MFLLDVNILINAFRDNQPRHKEFRHWLGQTVASDQAFSIPSLVRSGFLRIITNAHLFAVPTPLEEAVGFLDDFMERPNFLEVNPGPRHWEIFTGLCRKVGAKGNLIPDAYLAALAIECGGEWITADKGYSKFPGLLWRHPLDYKGGGPKTFDHVEEPRRRYRARKRPALKA